MLNRDCEKENDDPNINSCMRNELVRPRQNEIFADLILIEVDMIYAALSSRRKIRGVDEGGRPENQEGAEVPGWTVWPQNVCFRLNSDVELPPRPPDLNPLDSLSGKYVNTFCFTFIDGQFHKVEKSIANIVKIYHSCVISCRFTIINILCITLSVENTCTENFP